MRDSSRQLALHAGAVVALLATAFAVEYATDVLLTQRMVGTGGAPAFLPTFGTPGETLTVYLVVGTVVSRLVVPLSIGYVAYRYGTIQGRSGTEG